MRKLILVCATLLFWLVSLQGQIVRKQLHPIQKDGKWGFIDSNGRVAIEPQFTWVGSFSEGLAPVCIGRPYAGGKNGYIDVSGKIVIPPQFDESSDFSEQMAVVVQRSKSGYIDQQGRILIEPRFDTAEHFMSALALVSLSSARGYINTRGEFVWKSS